MAQGQFTKQEAKETLNAVEEMFKAIPKSKRTNYIGHLNDIFLFLEAAKRAAPIDITSTEKPCDTPSSE